MIENIDEVDLGKCHYLCGASEDCSGFEYTDKTCHFRKIANCNPDATKIGSNCWIKGSSGKSSINFINNHTQIFELNFDHLLTLFKYYDTIF